jgi:hypothetical protein
LLEKSLRASSKVIVPEVVADDTFETLVDETEAMVEDDE